MQFADLRFPTPTGRIEIASAAAEADGHPRLPQPWSDPRPASGRLRLLTPASPWLMNDSFANDRKLTKRIGAAARGAAPGRRRRPRGLARRRHGARLIERTGWLELGGALSDKLPRGVAYSLKGRWPEAGAAAGERERAQRGRQGRLRPQTSVHGVEVTVSPS